MKRIKVQRGYLAQNPYKRAKFYDQGFENVRNPPRTPHLQTYGKKYDLMKLLQVVTALMQLRKNEVNKSPVVQFKEGMKRNMERIKPAMRAAEQHFLGKPALDSLYNKTVEEINQMLRQRVKYGENKNHIEALMNETEEGRKKAYYGNANRYERVAELIKDLVKQYKGNNRNLRMLASQIDASLASAKNSATRKALENVTDEKEKDKIKFAIDREFREFFNPANLSEGSLADNSGLQSIYPIFHKQAPPDPSIIDISSAKALLDGLEDDVTSDRNWEAVKIFYEPQLKHKMLFEKLTGLTPTIRDLMFTEQFLGENPNYEEEFERAKMRKEQVESGAKGYAQGDRSAIDQVKRAQSKYNKLIDDFNRYLFDKNKTFSVAMIPRESGSMDSNITLAPIVLASLPESALPPPPMPLPPLE